MADHRLVITVCRRERGAVRLPIEPGTRPVRIDAERLARELEAAARRRGLDAVVQVRDGCAGGCWGEGPNVDVRIYGASDEVAVRFRTYVYSLADLPSVASIIDENLPAASRARRPAR